MFTMDPIHHINIRVGGGARWLERWSMTAKLSLRHDVQLMGDILGVNRPLYVSQHGKTIHSSF